MLAIGLVVPSACSRSGYDAWLSHDGGPPGREADSATGSGGGADGDAGGQTGADGDAEVSVSPGGEFLWSLAMPSMTNQTYAKGLAIGGDGRVVIAGMLQQTVDFLSDELTSAGSPDIFVATYSAAGVPEWAKRWGDIDVQEAEGLAVDPDGNIVFVARFSGTLDLGPGRAYPATDEDAAVVNLDPAGSVRWAVHLEAGDVNSATAVATDSAGNVFVGGMVAQAIDFGGGTVSISGQTFYLVSYDSTGAYRWVMLVPTGGGELARIAVDGAGYPSFGGRFVTSIDLGGGPIASAGSHDLFVGRADDDGGLLWADTIGSTSLDDLDNLTVSNTGETYWAATFVSTLTVGATELSPVGSIDIALAGYAATGEVLWATSYGGSGSDIPAGLDYRMGALHMVGSSTEGIDFGDTAVGPGIFLATFASSDGRHLAARAWSTSGVLVREVALSNDAAIVLTGSFTDTLDFGGPILTSVGQSDPFLLKLTLE